MKSQTVEQAVAVLKAGGLILYPTEGVYGIGCCPEQSEAIQKLLRAKNRASDKGLILVASELSQLNPFIAPLNASDTRRVMESWPGPVTWLLPAAPNANPLLTGVFKTQACRVSAHPTVQALCRAFNGPIVSTSANMAGQAPALTALSALEQCPMVSGVVEGEIGELKGPTTILKLGCESVIRGK